MVKQGRTTRVIGIRLPHELVDAIDAEAEALGMSRNELLSRRLTAAFSHAPGNRKTVQNNRETAPAFEGLPDE